MLLPTTSMGVGYLLNNQKPCGINTSVTSELGTSPEHNGALVSISDYANEVACYIIEENKRSNKAREQQRTVINTNKVESIEEGHLFEDKKTFKEALCYYAIISNFQFKVKRSEPREYVATCVDDNCKWYIRASNLKKTQTFIVRKFVNTHTCSLDIIMEDHRQANCNVVGELVKNKFNSFKRIHTPSDIMKDMLDDYGVSMSYSKAYRSREKALQLVRGKADESYGELPMYLHMLRVANPGTMTSLVTTDNNKFKYLYIAYANSIHGWQHCRPVIVVDGTFMKASYGGTLFTASTMDASNNIFPLAFGVGDSENDEAWQWFFTKLRESYGAREGNLLQFFT